MKNPEAESEPSVFGRIQAGIRAMETRAAAMMVRRRPTNWERYPRMVPPTQAPTFIIMEARDAAELSRALPVRMKVV